MKLKALLSAIAFLALQVTVYSQITYEGSIDKKTHSFTLDNGELKHASYDKANKAIVLYHADDSQWKSVPVKLERNHYFDELKSVSVNIFNDDALVELAYTCLEYRTSFELEATTDYVEVHSTLVVINEEGTPLLEAEDSYDMKLVNSNGEAKLLVYKLAGQSGNSKEHIDVYALPAYHSTDFDKLDGSPFRYGVLGYRSGI